MTAILIDGIQQASSLRAQIYEDVVAFRKTNGYAPGLAAVLIGDNPASHVYVHNKEKACKAVGIRSQIHLLPSTVSELEVLTLIQHLNQDEKVHGILVQLPLPSSLSTTEIISCISPHKDVDGLHPHNLGLLLMGRGKLMPCTPLGCLHLIQSVMPNLAGKRAIVVGRSLLVGRSTALLLSHQDATVIQAHSHTENLAQECKSADIVVTAVGNPGFLTADYIKPGAIVIDVGITRVFLPDGTKTIAGDVDFNQVRHVAGFLTPVPGGVGPMTVAYLLKNTLTAALHSVS